MIETIEYKGKLYPKFQSVGYAAQFAIPYAQHVCKGIGYDIGCNRPEWSFPNSIPIDLALGSNALELPEILVDYIFSSHCLEHLQHWVEALDHWSSRLKVGGVIFLYLPHRSQEYWNPWNNRKHIHMFDQEIIRAYFEGTGFTKVYVSGTDLNNSFMAMAEKL
jgi:predicted SAM-dependent methyltransferase